MAGEQQRDYWRDMTRRGDVRYTVSWGDKDDQLLTPLHFNCQNKKLVPASCVFSWGRGGGGYQTVSSHRQKHTYHKVEASISSLMCQTRLYVRYHKRAASPFVKLFETVKSHKCKSVIYESKRKALQNRTGRPSILEAALSIQSAWIFRALHRALNISNNTYG